MESTRAKNPDNLSVEYRGLDGNSVITMIDSGNEILDFVFPDGTITLTFWELMAMQELWLRKQREDVIKTD